ncbi:unnamed protein product [marine sediment metagenome]|uniref:Uncharacterized protein n=1 Tax=marine sediment metagenome TaxID=412755 RepID=X1GY56_9ZZZZ
MPDYEGPREAPRSHLSRNELSGEIQRYLSVETRCEVLTAGVTHHEGRSEIYGAGLSRDEFPGEIRGPGLSDDELRCELLETIPPDDEFPGEILGVRVSNDKFRKEVPRDLAVETGCKILTPSLPDDEPGAEASASCQPDDERSGEILGI